MDQVKIQHTSIRSLFFGSALFLLFSLITLLSPKSAMAQGTQCLGAWFDFKSVTVNSVSGLDSRITTTTSNIPVEVTITPSKSSDNVYWADLSARKYSLEATRSDGSVVSVSPDSRYQNPSNSSQLVLLFNLPGSEFTKLANDQQTGYAVNLKVPYRSHCLVASYTATRLDNQPPPKTCGPATRGQCAATAGCGANEVCIDEGVNFVCKKLPGSCGYKTCGGIGNPANGDVCNCAGTTFTPMTGTNNSCCGWVVNGSCSNAPAPFAANCGSELKILSKSGLDTTLPKDQKSLTVSIDYQYKTRDLNPYSLLIQSGQDAFAYTAPTTSTTVNATTRNLSFTITDPTLFNPHPDGRSDREYTVELFGDNKAEFLCSAGVYLISPTESAVQNCVRANYGQCGSLGGCTKATQQCTASGCKEINGQCGYTAPLPPPGGGEETGPDGAETGPSDQGSLLDAVKGPTNKTFDALNPLNIAAGLKGEPAKSPYFRTFSTPGGIISRVLLFAFPIAGIILFLMIVWGGFEMVTGATNAKSMDAGKQRITAAVIGFGLLFVSYWLMQIIELVFGLSIL